MWGLTSRQSRLFSTLRNTLCKDCFFSILKKCYFHSSISVCYLVLTSVSASTFIHIGSFVRAFETDLCHAVLSRHQTPWQVIISSHPKLFWHPWIVKLISYLMLCDKYLSLSTLTTVHMDVLVSKEEKPTQSDSCFGSCKIWRLKTCNLPDSCSEKEAMDTKMCWCTKRDHF